MNNLSMPPQAMNSSRAMVTVGVVHAVGLVDKDDSVVNLRHAVIQLRDYNILHSQPVGKPPRNAHCSVVFCDYFYYQRAQNFTFDFWVIVNNRRFSSIKPLPEHVC